jgi:hypothetical protein
MEDPNIKDPLLRDLQQVSNSHCVEIYNKDCDLGKKPSYRENLTHACWIWDAYEWQCLNLNVYL